MSRFWQRSRRAPRNGGCAGDSEVHWTHYDYSLHTGQVSCRIFTNTRRITHFFAKIIPEDNRAWLRAAGGSWTGDVVRRYSSTSVFTGTRRRAFFSPKFCPARPKALGCGSLRPQQGCRIRGHGKSCRQWRDVTSGQRHTLGRLKTTIRAVGRTWVPL